MDLAAVSRAVVPPVLATVYRAWSATWRYDFVHRDVFDDALAEGPVVFAFWHGEQLPVFRPHGGRGIAGMASRSRDGELLARIIERLGFGVIRGSTSSGGATALRESIDAVSHAGVSCALAVDGPRGPYHQPHPGALAIAGATSRPLIYVVSTASPALVLGSWDRFVLPVPGARVRIGYGRMDIAANDRETVEEARVELKLRMDLLGASLSSVSPMIEATTTELPEV